MPEHLLTFVHITDTHIPTDAQTTLTDVDIPPYEGALRLVEAVNALPITPDFVLHTGDVAYNPEPNAYENPREILGRLRFPVYYVSGNHDGSMDLQRAMLSSDEPMPQLHYTFEHSGVQFAIVDSNGPAEPPRGYLTESQLEFLQGICNADDPRPLVIATHHNPVKVGIPWMDEFMGMQNGELFHQAILPARDRLRGVFFGHVHQDLTIYRDGILYCSTVSSWRQLHAWPGQEGTVEDQGAEPGFSVVTISRDQTFIRRHRYNFAGQ